MKAQKDAELKGHSGTSQIATLALIILIIVGATAGFVVGSFENGHRPSNPPRNSTTTSTVFQSVTIYQTQTAGSTTVTWTQYQTNIVDQNDSLSGLLVSNMTVGGFPDSIGINEKTNTVYVEYAFNTTNLAVINGSTDSLMAIIPLGKATQATPIINPDTDTVYIGNVIINGTTNKVIATFNQSVTFIAANPKLNVVYAMSSASNGRNGTTTISEINGTTNEVSSSLSISGVPEAGDNPIAMNENTGVLYLTMCTTDCGFLEQYVVGVGVTSSGFLHVVSQILLNKLVFNIAVNPTTNMIYITALQNLLVVINGTSEQIVNEIPITAYANELRGITVDPSSNEILLAGGPDCQGFSSCNNTLYVLSGGNYGIFATFVSNNPFVLQYDPANGQTYVLYYFSHFIVSVIIPHYNATILVP